MPPWQRPFGLGRYARAVNVYIVGAGAVGTYLGDELRRTGNAVVYGPRDSNAAEPLDIDLAIVAVKSFDTDAAIQTLRRAIRDPAATTIVTPQNGVGNEEKLAAAFGAENIVAAALTIPVGRDKDGKSLAASSGGIVFAPVGRANAHNWLLAAFGATSIPVFAAVDYRSLKWSKLALNAIANASCAILNVLPERLIHLNDVFALEIRAIREVRAVMKGLHIAPIDLPRYPVRALQAVVTLPAPVARLVLANRVAGARGRKPPSLLLDLRAAKNRTEVDVLNGAVARAARSVGVSAPVNTVFARVVSDIANMPQLWAKYRERPEALEAEVQAEAARRSRAVVSV
jgi:2-dehydropantoate 2-reductase